MSVTVGMVRTIETVKASGLEDDVVRPVGRPSGQDPECATAARRSSAVFLDMIPTLLSGLSVAAMLGSEAGG